MSVDLPFPFTAKTPEELIAQTMRMFSDLYQERVGGAQLGDVFSIGGDEVLSLNLSASGGLEKSTDGVGIKLKPAGNLGLGSTGLYVTGSSSFKVGTFTRDMTAVTGDVAYSGVGFSPLCVLFFSTETTLLCWGADTVTNKYMMSQQAVGGAYYLNTGSSIQILTSSAPLTGQGAFIKTMDADGFTLTWAKSGTPAAGTMSVFYVAMKIG
jgi:hypothetical protein